MITGDDIKQLLSMMDVAVRYGFQPDRNNNIKCPFHNDRHPSLKIYTDPGRGFYCYSCNAGGSVIDFVMKLYGLNYKQAMLRLSSDFGYSDEPSKRIDMSKVRKRQWNQQIDEEINAWAIHMLAAAHCRMHWIIKTAEPFSDEWCWAVKSIDYISYRWEVLACPI